MGAHGVLGFAVVVAVALAPAARVAASTVVEPIARLSVEGGYDSNALYAGRGGDRTGRVSPEVGLRLRDHLWDASAAYAGDWVVYDRLAPGGNWNHRAGFLLAATPTRRLELSGDFRGAYSFDPVGLAQIGVFRIEQESAWLVQGRGRIEYRATRRVDVAAGLFERAVVFGDGTGGAMHQPSVEALWRHTRRLSFGGGYSLGLFQSFGDGADGLAHANALRGRARYRITRHVEVNGHAGPAVWSGPDGRAIVPEAGVEMQWATRAWDLRLAASHGLGIGSTARPALVDGFEGGGVRRFGRRYDIRGDGGIWRSGRAPGGGDSTLGYALGGEAGMLVAGGVRLALAASHFARLDDRSDALSRTTIGIRLGWGLTAR